jgi:hypothetical protein
MPTHRWNSSAGCCAAGKIVLVCACVVVFQGSSIFVSVARPPRTLEHAAHIALEHVLTGADNINDGTTPFPRYAASLIDAHLWHFWWD